MTSAEMDRILEAQRRFFATGATLDIKFRKAMLKKLYNAVKAREKDITDALTADLGKSAFEGFMCEAGLALTEVSHMIRNLARYSRRRIVPTPITQFHSVSYVKPCPYGNVLIMSPWNYPFLLTIDPLADAIAAGNTCIVKPSAYSPATSKVISEIISECFPEEYISVVTGGRQENAALLEKKFDMIFFTGSKNVGKEVLRRAAEHLTPAVLELGGKSPCIVDDTANIALAAKRIVFGKFLNCGQTCVAPDYILCASTIKDKLISEIKYQIETQYGSYPLGNNDYGKIVNKRHYDRICGLIDQTKVVCGGKNDDATLRIEPTVMADVDRNDPVMQEEIFGPVLPILTYDDFSEVIPMVESRDKPLALYIFSSDKKRIADITARCRYGGGCVNDVVIHLATSAMGFGGVGESGMGAYHGKTGFDAFSHLKSILDKKTWLDLPMRYQPYNRFYGKLLRLFLR